MDCTYLFTASQESVQLSRNPHCFTPYRSVREILLSWQWSAWASNYQSSQKKSGRACDHGRRHVLGTGPKRYGSLLVDSSQAWRFQYFSFKYDGSFLSKICSKSKRYAKLSSLHRLCLQLRQIDHEWSYNYFMREGQLHGHSWQCFSL